ncbi:MAG: dTMP kinase [Enterobacteriaceae bacterium]
MKSKFIVVEGLDGSGKTTLVKFIYKVLKNKYKIEKLIKVCDPGGTPLSRILGKIIKKSNKLEKINYYTELLIFYAARSQLVSNIIKPYLNNNYWVISDRYKFSSEAYQGSYNKNINILIKNLNKIIVKNVEPDLIFYLDINPKIGFERIKKNRKLDIIEKKRINFFYKVRRRYKKIMKKNKNVIILNSNKPTKLIFKNVKNYLKSWIKKI